RAMHVEDDALAVPDGFKSDAYLIEQATGVKRTRLFHPPASQMWHGPARAAAVIAIDHFEGAPDTLVRASTGELLAALWPAILSPASRVALDAAAALGDVNRFILHTTTPAHALEHVLQLASDLGVGP